jgi:hypothetical protein
VNSLAIFGAFFSDAQHPEKYLELDEATIDRPSTIAISYRRPPHEAQLRLKLESRLRRHMRALGCIPLGRIDPGLAGSIHYAGTLPFSNPLNPELATQPDHRLAGCTNVFVGDSSSWNWLPSKGLTFTAMAASRLIAARAVASL